MRERLRRPRFWIAWGLFVGFAGMVLWLGGSHFSANHTAGYLGPLLQWLFPDMSAIDRYHLHVRTRKLAHSVEYGVLALLAFRAVYVSMEAVLVRIAGLAMVLVLLVAAIDESRQAFSPTRTGSVWDVGLDLLGAVLVLGFVLWWRRRPAEPA
ncbi:MAG: VanZ family protein [Myxococcota bacterium]